MIIGCLNIITCLQSVWKQFSLAVVTSRVLLFCLRVVYVRSSILTKWRIYVHPYLVFSFFPYPMLAATLLLAVFEQKRGKGNTNFKPLSKNILARGKPFLFPSTAQASHCFRPSPITDLKRVISFPVARLRPVGTWRTYRCHLCGIQRSSQEL
jgi:hypothetical protein